MGKNSLSINGTMTALLILPGYLNTYVQLHVSENSFELKPSQFHALVFLKAQYCVLN
jgi:hypothetical protein